MMDVAQTKDAMRKGHTVIAEDSVWMQASAELRAEAQNQLVLMKAAVNDYLDNDGSRGRYDALALTSARRRLNALLAGECSSGYCGWDPNTGDPHTCPEWAERR